MTDHLQSKKCKTGIPVWYRGALSSLFWQKKEELFPLQITSK